MQNGNEVDCLVVQQNKETAETVVLRRVYEALRPPNDLFVAEIVDGNWLSDVTEAITSLGINPPGGWELLFQGFANEQDEIYMELLSEYTRLFINDYGGTPAPPLASVYLTSSSENGGMVALQVAEWYCQAGMALPPDYPEPPDALSVELEFLIYLQQAITEAGTARVVKELEVIKHNFCAEHMAKWIPQFALRVHAAGAKPFYSTVVELLVAVVIYNV